MAEIQTFAEFFGAFAPPPDPGSVDSDTSIEFARRSNLAAFGRTVSHVDENGVLTSFLAVVYKERRERVDNQHGFDELILRDVSFPADDETGRAVIQRHQEMRIDGTKYSIEDHFHKDNFWRVTLRRLKAHSVTSRNRTGTR